MLSSSNCWKSSFFSSPFQGRNGQCCTSIKIMGFVSLEHWPSKVILVIAFLYCFSCFTLSAGHPGEELVVIPGNDIKGPYEGWLRRERGAIPGRRSSYMEVSASAVNATTEAGLLLEFRKAITADPFHVLSDWNNKNVSNYCSWGGVNCSSPMGPVNALNLSGHQLKGSISSALGGLQFLSSLDLSQNYFEGTIPSSIANCSHLIFLNISLNTLVGWIPPELKALSNLQQLDLSFNFLAGALPPSLSNLSALTLLVLGSNQFNGDMMSLPWGGFGKLETLDFSVNLISGAIPESLSNCSSLGYLDLSWNNFTGIIPDKLAKLQRLQTLGLGHNSLTGSIPPALGRLKAISTLYLPFNSLTGFIPQTLLNCSSLTGLYLYSNRLTGIIPPDIGILSQLQDIFLWNNSLTGSIPPSLVNCTSLSKIIFSINFFDGVIPQALGTLSQLKDLYLHTNDFVGVIPDSLANVSTLQEVLLNENGLDGVIPSQLGLLKNLSKLDLSSNVISGLIPTTLGDSSALIYLALANNLLTGEIPSSIGKLINLQGLNLSGNLLTGGIPMELLNCIQLSVLDLSGNSLSDSLPDGLGALTALNQLYLNNNNFTGSILPALRQRSTSLIEISLAHNSFSGVISGYDFGSLRNLQLSLDLSDNLFTGPLPSGIGTLESVQKINMSFNAFSGTITGALSHCTGLESLDLSSNNLDGKIPQSLTALQHLTYFNVSFNQLSGSVPDSGPFVNFNNGSFLGNLELCGPMLPRKCGSSCSGIRCHKLWLVIFPAVAAGIACALALAGIWFLFFAKTNDSSGMVAPALPNATSFTIEVEGLSVGDIVAATNGFSDGSIMGVGSKSTVFAGVLPSGVMIAVKRLEMRSDDKALGQLYRELKRLSELDHPNLLKVYGLFSSSDLKALVLEYMPNGSLRKQMYEGQTCRLTWPQRLHIALGVAEAMVHLHHAGSKPIVHVDLKPSNILLDSDMGPKVADYGIARFVNHESHGDTTISSNLYGTIGYIPPEYGALTSVSTMGDVYNFGVVLMELFTRKQPTDDMFGQDISLRSWVLNAFPGRISQILDGTLHQELAQNEQDVGIHLMVRLAVACTRNSPKDRPTMIEARDMLMEIKSIEQPYKSGQ